jgi:NAD(P)-dependent dehydrogenase (short-subunit alcohol dehydrogenase family)
LATTRLLLSNGGRALITGRDSQALDAAVRELGAGVTAVRSDTSRLSEIGALAEKVRSFGPIDLLFINAGIGGFVPFGEVSEDFYDRVFATNLKGAFFTAQKLAPHVRDGGSILVTTSVLADRSTWGSSVYSATKAGLRSLVRSLALELLPRGIRVNAVSPGPIATPILQKAGLSKTEVDAVIGQVLPTVPMKRVGTPEEVARAVLHLGFDATYSTGTELTVDGGLLSL